MAALSGSGTDEKKTTQGEYRLQSRRNFLRTALGSDDGRLFFWSLLESAGIFRSTFQGEGTHGTAFAEGRRSMGLMIFDSLLDADSDALSAMRDASRRMSGILEMLPKDNEEEDDDDL